MLKSWHQPYTLLQMRLLVVLEQGCQGRIPCRIVVAMVILSGLGLFRWLRPGELLALTVRDLLVHRDYVVAAIRSSKKKRHTLASHIQEVMAAMVWAQIPEATHLRFVSFVRDFAWALDAPPSIP